MGSWCIFWSHNESYDNSKRLPPAFYNELKPLFIRLSDDSLLNRCLLGLTQNQNEAINQVLWSKCPKTRFCGRVKLELAVCETITKFNSGAGSKAVLLKTSGVAPGTNMLAALRKADNTRIKFAARKISVKARLARRKLRAKKNLKQKKKLRILLVALACRISQKI